MAGCSANLACIGTSPEEQAANVLGDGRGEEGPEHRPGQPCLACHGEDYSPGEAVFVLAGTIYFQPSDSDDQGIPDADVVFTDSEGREFAATTNRAGNFMVSVNTSLSEPRVRDRGRLQIPWQPTFPLAVSVKYDGNERDMESQIFREGSCATCHYGETAGTDHVERVWAEEMP